MDTDKIKSVVANLTGLESVALRVCLGRRGAAEEEQAMPAWEKLSECVSVTDCGVSIDDPECGRVRVSLVDSEDERGPGDDEIAALLHGRLGNRWHRVTDWSSASLEPDVTSTWEVWS